MAVESDLILSIYDAAIDPDLWPAVLLKAARFVGARGATVFELGEIAEDAKLKMSMCSENYSADRNRYYLENHWENELKDQEVFANCSKRTDQIELIPDTVLYSSRDEYLAREHVQVLRQFEVGYRAAALLNKDLPSMDRFAFQFSDDHGPIERYAVQRGRLILPHLAKALNVARPIRELKIKNKAIAATIDRLTVGVCIVDQYFNLLISNAEFNRQIDCFTVFSRNSSGKLTIDHELAPALSSLLSSSFQYHGLKGARPRKEAVVFATASKDQHLCVDVIPCDSAPEFDLRNKKLSILFSLDTTNKLTFESGKIGQIFDLTPAELEVLKLVSEGFTNRQISDQLEKSVHTVDTQIKSILSKCMAANRAQLIRIISQTGSYLLPL